MPAAGCQWVRQVTAPCPQPSSALPRAHCKPRGDETEEEQAASQRLTDAAMAPKDLPASSSRFLLCFCFLLQPVSHVASSFFPFVSTSILSPELLFVLLMLGYPLPPGRRSL